MEFFISVLSGSCLHSWFYWEFMPGPGRERSLELTSCSLLLVITFAREQSTPGAENPGRALPSAATKWIKMWQHEGTNKSPGERWCGQGQELWAIEAWVHGQCQLCRSCSGWTSGAGLGLRYNLCFKDRENETQRNKFEFPTPLREQDTLSFYRVLSEQGSHRELVPGLGTAQRHPRYSCSGTGIYFILCYSDISEAFIQVQLIFELLLYFLKRKHEMVTGRDAVTAAPRGWELPAAPQPHQTPSRRKGDSKGTDWKSQLQLKQLHPIEQRARELRNL